MINAFRQSHCYIHSRPKSIKELEIEFFYFPKDYHLLWFLFFIMLRKVKYFKPKFAPCQVHKNQSGLNTWSAFKMDFLVCILSSHCYPVASSNTPTPTQPLAFLMRCYCWSEHSLKHQELHVFKVFLCVISNCFTAVQHTGNVFSLPKNWNNQDISFGARYSPIFTNNANNYISHQYKNKACKVAGLWQVIIRIILLDTQDLHIVNIFPFPWTNSLHFCTLVLSIQVFLRLVFAIVMTH